MPQLWQAELKLGCAHRTDDITHIRVIQLQCAGSVASLRPWVAQLQDNWEAHFERHAPWYLF